MLALQVSAVLAWLIALGFGLPTPFVATHLLRERTLPIFMGLFPAYGGGIFQRWSPEVFVLLLGLFAALSALEAFAGVLLWQGERLGAILMLGLLPFEIVFWLGFALPIPPLFALVRLALLFVGRDSLH
jgi:hypothetical protein